MDVLHDATAADLSAVIRREKAAIRAAMKAALARVEAGQRQAASRAALAGLQARPEWQQAKAVLLFAPLADELDLWPAAERVLAAGARLALPRFDAGARLYGAAVVGNLQRDVVPGHWGIREPAAHCPAQPLNQLDFALIPGLAFDRSGRRLGRGKGYYDQLLPAITGLRCGVAMDLQVVPELPVEQHDQYVDCILTPTRWLAVARRTADE
jgi:5-formyltetrahydrofolate cyclo-ligase